MPTIMLAEHEIERIVQEVIRRLTAAGMRVTSAASDVLELEQRLVTLSTIEGRLDGVRQLVVAPKAVITPSVRDELRSRNIEFVRKAQ